MAVYTKISFDEAKDFLANFNLGSLDSITEITEGIENTNYLIQTSNAKYILTIFEKRVNPDDLPFYFAYMANIHKAGVMCPEIQININGDKIHTLKNKKAIIISFLDGKSIDTIPSVKQCHSLGQTVAKMHISSTKFKLHTKNSMGLDSWNNIFMGIKTELDSATYNLISKELEFQKIQQASLAKQLSGGILNYSDIQSGIVHADLFIDNVFFQGDKVSGVIDFYFSCTDFFLYDLAITLTAWCFRPDFKGLDFSLTKGLLAGYQEHRIISKIEVEWLNMFVRGASLRFLLTRLFDEIHTQKNATVVVKDPQEYRFKLAFYQEFSFEKSGLFGEF